jgi:hypothetical protein
LHFTAASPGKEKPESSPGRGRGPPGSQAFQVCKTGNMQVTTTLLVTSALHFPVQLLEKTGCTASWVPHAPRVGVTGPGGPLLGTPEGVR